MQQKDSSSREPEAIYSDIKHDQKKKKKTTHTKYPPETKYINTK